MKLKILILLGLLVFPGIVSAATKDADLDVGESILIEDKNITLYAANNDGFLICMNGQKYLINDDKNIEGVLFDVKTIREGNVRFEISLKNNDNDCVNCSNEDCMKITSSTTTTSTTTLLTSTTSTTTTLLQNSTIIPSADETDNSSLRNTFLILLGVLLFLLIIALIYRKKSHKYWKQKQKYY